MEKDWIFAPGIFTGAIRQIEVPLALRARYHGIVDEALGRAARPDAGRHYRWQKSRWLGEIDRLPARPGSTLWAMSSVV